MSDDIPDDCEEQVQFIVAAWRVGDDDLWHAGSTALTLEEMRMELQQKGQACNEIVEIAQMSVNGSDTEGVGDRYIDWVMNDFGWALVEERGLWLAPVEPPDIGPQDHPVRWYQKGVHVRGGPITESGYYVDPPCHPGCCRPDGPFKTKEEARQVADEDAEAYRMMISPK